MILENERKAKLLLQGFEKQERLLKMNAQIIENITNWIKETKSKEVNNERNSYA